MVKKPTPASIEPFFYVQKQGQHVVQGKPDPGVYYVWFTEKDGEIVEHSALVCSPELEVLEMARDGHDDNWQYYARWRDPDGNEHEGFIAASWLEGGGAKVRQYLASGGLRLSPAARQHDPLLDYIRSQQPKERCRIVSSPGWHKDMYVLPDGDVVGARDGERVILHYGDAKSRIRRRQIAGTLEEWQTHVASPSERNPLLQLSICTSLTGPVLRFVNQSSFGFHIMGPSSTGKTVTAAAGGSVWGTNREKPGMPNVEGWHATVNGLEGIAGAHNDGFVVLDEMGNVAPKAAAVAVYMLSEGREKARKDRDSNLKPPRDWSLTYMSTGEVGLENLVAEEGKRVHGGQMVRLIELSSDAGAGMGVFEDLHAMASPTEFADSLMKASCTYYGTAMRAFLRITTQDRDAVECRLRQLREEYRPRFSGAVGEVLRVGAIFALEAAVGEFCIEAGILPWPSGSTVSAMETCFQRWIDHRGTTGALDEESAIGFIRGFIGSQQTRFQWLERDPESRNVNIGLTDVADASQAQRQGPVRDRVGYRRRIGSGKEQDFIFLPESLKDICRKAGYDPRFVVQALRSREYLTTEKEHDTVKRALPDHDKPIRVYVVKSSILETPERTV
jgi:uncharacterized protein (DUF927 family)